MKKRKEDISKIRLREDTLKDKMKNPEYKCAMMEILLDAYKEYKKRV